MFLQLILHRHTLPGILPFANKQYDSYNINTDNLKPQGQLLEKMKICLIKMYLRLVKRQCKGQDSSLGLRDMNWENHISRNLNFPFLSFFIIPLSFLSVNKTISWLKWRYCAQSIFNPSEHNCLSSLSTSFGVYSFVFYENTFSFSLSSSMAYLNYWFKKKQTYSFRSYNFSGH